MLHYEHGMLYERQVFKLLSSRNEHGMLYKRQVFKLLSSTRLKRRIIRLAKLKNKWNREGVAL
jgi:hypothetical protein